MQELSIYATETRNNPLDIVEQIVLSNEWTHERRNDNELAAEVAGGWCDYSMFFCWREELETMHFSCALDLKVPPMKRGGISELLMEVNEKLWLGHFGVWTEEGVPMFRHSLILRGSACTSVETIEDLVDTALFESDRFFPAFQYVIWGGKDAREAIQLSLLDVAGQA
ncbi:hypothetical protein GH722_02655 [Alphaproteobacteria bacterium HT1-32]|nr:hypothetical protein [Alphaproteobacteria bacterium HT1-32]|tara:strand:- start:23553 stop:24056 length:504 start_codon:yes stop_codon:yes gene_type:complete